MCDSIDRFRRFHEVTDQIIPLGALFEDQRLRKLGVPQVKALSREDLVYRRRLALILLHEQA